MPRRDPTESLPNRRLPGRAQFRTQEEYDRFLQVLNNPPISADIQARLDVPKETPSEAPPANDDPTEDDSTRIDTPASSTSSEDNSSSSSANRSRASRLAASCSLKMQILTGACYIDTILSVPAFPTEDSKLRATSILRRRGGNACNTLQVLQELFAAAGVGVATRNRPLLLAVMPDEDSFDFKSVIETSFPLGREYALESCVFRHQEQQAASSYIIRSEETGSRTIVSHNPLQEMSFKEFAQVADAFEDGEASLFHFEGRIPDTTGECMRYVREYHGDALISLEVEKAGREELEELIGLADLVFFSKSWAQHKGFKTAPTFLRAMGKGMKVKKGALLCCTWGSEGACAWDTSESYREGIRFCPAFTVPGRVVVDTVGAGDAFIAGMIFCKLCMPKWDTDRMLTFANELAGRKVLQEGLKGVGWQMIRENSDERKSVSTPIRN